MEVGDIRSELKRLGLTQKQLADTLGMHKGDVSRLLSGKLRMRLDTFREIEAFLAAAERRHSLRGVAEPRASFERAPIRFVTLEEARTMGPAPPMSEEERERWYRELRELWEAAKRMPRVTDMTDDEILGYDEMV